MQKDIFMQKMNVNIPKTNQKRVVIIGCGFAGLKIAKTLSRKKNLQIVILDKNNYHQFQPLFYQVATAGLEPSAISFPLRKLFQHQKNIHIRVTEVLSVNSEQNFVNTSVGEISYDFLIISTGTDTNFFGMKNIQANALSMKSVSEAMFIRNTILQNYEDAVSETDLDIRKGLMNIVIVGGGPAGVEVAGTLAEMRRSVLPKDYPTLNFDEMNIFILEAADKLLRTMSENSSKKSQHYLEKMGVKVMLLTQVKDYDNNYVIMSDGSKIRTRTLIWTAGVKAFPIEGLQTEAIGAGGRLKVDRQNRILGYQNIFAVGDVALMQEEKFQNGHPQVAQVAIQQGKNVAENIIKTIAQKETKNFTYNDLGAMAFIGRNFAVVDLPFLKFSGFLAWLFWMFLHLMAIVGFKNRLMVFINWSWNYITYDQSLRLIFNHKPRKNKE